LSIYRVRWLASLAPTSTDRFQELLPRKRDKEAFIELMKLMALRVFL